jgi:hypothetical protein
VEDFDRWHVEQLLRRVRQELLRRYGTAKPNGDPIHWLVDAEKIEQRAWWQSPYLIRVVTDYERIAIDINRNLYRREASKVRASLKHPRQRLRDGELGDREPELPMILSRYDPGLNG